MIKFFLGWILGIASLGNVYLSDSKQAEKALQKMLYDIITMQWKFE